MVIYGEYLFIENFITGLIILYFTKKISGLDCRTWILVVGAILCGAYSFIIFLQLEGPIALAVKLAFAILVTTLVFRRETLRTALIFLAVSFLLGGATMALLLTFDLPGITAGGAFYMEGLTYAGVTVCIACGGGIIWWFAELIRGKRLESRRVLGVAVVFGGQYWQVRALIDSGNFLREPISGRPVAIMEEDFAREIIKVIPDRQSRFHLVPYRAIGTDNGLMEGYRADYIIVGDKKIRSPIVAIYKGKFDGEYNMLLHMEMIEGGIVTDEEML